MTPDPVKGDGKKFDDVSQERAKSKDSNSVSGRDFLRRDSVRGEKAVRKNDGTRGAREDGVSPEELGKAKTDSG